MNQESKWVNSFTSGFLLKRLKSASKNHFKNFFKKLKKISDVVQSELLIFLNVDVSRLQAMFRWSGWLCWSASTLPQLQHGM
jgi:hypothetical protein